MNAWGQLLILTLSLPAGNLPLAIYLVVLATVCFITGLWCCYKMMISPLARRYPVRTHLENMPSAMSSASDDDGGGGGGIPSLSSDQAEALEDVPFLSNDQAEVPEDALSILGLFSTNWREPVVKFRHARP